MASEWQEVAIASICERVYSGGTPRSTVREYFDGGSIPWLKTKEVNYRNIYTTEARITEAGLANSSAKMVPINSVIVAMYGDGETAGRVAINKIPLTTNQACCNLLVDPNRADYRFVYYVLRTRYNDLVDLKNGGGQQNLNAQLIKSFKVRLPEISVQRTIADMLEAFDDRIELSSRMSDNLEAIARAVFKSWFVDFGPIRAKAEGRDPEGMNAATAALFPDEFIESGEDELPFGWSIQHLSDFVAVNPLRSLSKAVPAPYLEMANAPTSGPRPAGWVDRIPISGCRFRNGDTLLAKIAPCLENGKTAFVDFLDDGQIGWGSTEFVVLTPKPPIPPAFGYLLARDDEFRAHAIQSMSGTSGRQRIQVDQLAKFKFAVADAAVYGAFGAIVQPLFDSIKHNDEMAKTLAELRDTLLPRLISGKLRVPEAEKLAEAVL